ncbi:relaxase/mobilization nuclease domain-containing protein [Streptomyces sp. NPDC053499]|uniref:relaxase/mobilization nuclease domain-containing protein n=1 Tax=Streptomyces sp. NPDC053499 TaxID=3365707 RepID=UPI0037D66EC2
MIAKITKGRRADRALRYDFGPGRDEEHVNPRVVTGNVPGTVDQLAHLIDAHTARRADIARPIWRCALRTAPDDPILPDTTWARIAERYVTRMGFGNCPWVAVRHGEDHIHLTISRVDWTGWLVRDAFDYHRSWPVVRDIERVWKLVNAEERSDRIAPQVTRPERAASQSRGAPRPEREELRTRIRAVRDATRGRGRSAFEHALTEAGVEWRAHPSASGGIRGYSFSLPTWRDHDGGQIWVAASKVAKDLRWPQLHAELAASRPDPVPPPVAQS